MGRAREVGVRSPCNVDMYHFHHGMGHSLCGIGGNTIRGIGWMDQQSCCALAFSPCLYLTRAGLIFSGHRRNRICQRHPPTRLAAMVALNHSV